MFSLLSKFKDEVVLFLLCLIRVPEWPCLVLVFWVIVTANRNQGQADSARPVSAAFLWLKNNKHLVSEILYHLAGIKFNCNPLKKPPNVGSNFIMRKQAETGSLTSLRSPSLKIM